jgi:hypothetical protein
MWAHGLELVTPLTCPLPMGRRLHIVSRALGSRTLT